MPPTLVTHKCYKARTKRGKMVKTQKTLIITMRIITHILAKRTLMSIPEKEERVRKFVKGLTILFT